MSHLVHFPFPAGLFICISGAFFTHTHTLHMYTNFSKPMWPPQMTESSALSGRVPSAFLPTVSVSLRLKMTPSIMVLTCMLQCCWTQSTLNSLHPRNCRSRDVKLMLICWRRSSGTRHTRGLCKKKKKKALRVKRRNLKESHGWGIPGVTYTEEINLGKIRVIGVGVSSVHVRRYGRSTRRPWALVHLQMSSWRFTPLYVYCIFGLTVSLHWSVIVVGSWSLQCCPSLSGLCWWVEPRWGPDGTDAVPRQIRSCWCQ